MRYLFLSRRHVVLAALLASTQLTAQWVKYPTAGVPRKADGKVDIAAAAPRMADGGAVDRLAEENQRHRVKKDFEVEPQRGIADVPDVECCFVSLGDAAPPADLRPTGEPGSDKKTR